MVTLTVEEREQRRREVLERLAWDAPLFASEFFKIVNKEGALVPFRYNPQQERLFEALRGQQERGLPMRAIILKARQLGFSTAAQGMLVQRATRHPNHRAVTIAQDKKTAGELFAVGERMYLHMPDWIKPPLRNQRKGQELVWGEPSRARRRQGAVGLDSVYTVDTAAEFEAGRGLTIRSLHCSEVAFWPDAKRKLTGVLQAVPDQPGTLVIIESTANGFNYFKTLWDDAEAGRSDYVPLFFPWWEEPAYSRPFANEAERAEFERTVGEGEVRAAEPDLIERFGLTLEQLHWRYRKIMSPNFAGDVRLFQQEYPSFPEEAFLATGETVFAAHIVSKVIEHTRQTDPRPPVEGRPDVGRFRIKTSVMRNARMGQVEVPTRVVWQPEPNLSVEEGVWRVWQHPVLGGEGREPGQYILAVDPAGDSDMSAQSTATARHAIQVIDHKTRVQCAEFAFRGDPDQVALQAMLAAVYYNRPWLAVEITGGYGLSIVQRLYYDFGYTKLYTRRAAQDAQGLRMTDRLGWSTDARTKPMLVDYGKELLRTSPEVVRSHALALEMKTFVRNGRRMEPQEGYLADLLMAWLIAQYVALEKPVLPRKPASGVVTSTRPRNPITGY